LIICIGSDRIALIYKFLIIKIMLEGLGIANPLGERGLPELIQSGLNFAIAGAAIICVLVLIFSGYMYITASGDEGKIEKATKSLTYAIVGLAICFISVLLVNFVLANILKAEIPDNPLESGLLFWTLLS
jgi:hypothetical protein